MQFNANHGDEIIPKLVHPNKKQILFRSNAAADNDDDD